jgi:hypothetical protein
MTAGGTARRAPSTPKKLRRLDFTKIGIRAIRLGTGKIKPPQVKAESHAFGAFLVEGNWRKEIFYLNRP